MTSGLFEELLIETAGGCNRRCPTCLRQSAPKQAGRFGKLSLMPEETVYSLIDQAAEMGFTGRLNFQWFNEPLMDKRLPAFAAYAKAKGQFASVQAYTNFDLLTPEMAATLDGVFDILYVALYGEVGGTRLQDGGERQRLVSSWFSRTALDFSAGDHWITHNWTRDTDQLQRAIDYARPLPCRMDVTMRCIIAFDGTLRLCCDDIAGMWSLGSVVDTPLHELWYGEKHQTIIATLDAYGGREAYEWCRSCPRTEGVAPRPS